MWVGRGTYTWCVSLYMRDGIQQEILERFHEFDLHRCAHSFLLHVNMMHAYILCRDAYRLGKLLIYHPLLSSVGISC